VLPENIFAAYIFSGVTSWTHCIDSIHWQIRNISTMTGFIGYSKSDTQKSGRHCEAYVKADIHIYSYRPYCLFD